MKKLLLFFLSFSVAGVYAQDAVKNDTLEVYFPFRDANISKQASSFMDSLIFKDVLIHGQKLKLLGYADYAGTNEVNNTLSQVRAKNVKDYLVSSGYDPKDIILCAGLGKINRTAMKGTQGYSPDRKVQIIIDRETPAPSAPPVAAVKDVSKDISTAKVNEAVSLKNILFYPSSDSLLPESLPELDKLYLYLKDNPKVSVRIEGHICCSGEPTGVDMVLGNTTVSAARAKAVYDYLRGRGIVDARLSYKGLGNAGPLVYPEVTPEDQKLNRRVDVRILSK